MATKTATRKEAPDRSAATKPKPPEGMPKLKEFEAVAGVFAHAGDATKLQLLWCLGQDDGEEWTTDRLCEATAGTRHATAQRLSKMKASGLIRGGEGKPYELTETGDGVFDAINDYMGDDD